MNTDNKTKFHKVIGFSKKYYTLWEISDPYKYYYYQDSYEIKVDCIYIKNLSMDLETAKSKIEGDYKVDLDLRGKTSFSTLAPSQPDEFPDGELRGKKISLATDVYELLKMANLSKNSRLLIDTERDVLALDRLNELGVELIRYEKEYHTKEEVKILKAKKRFIKKIASSEYVGNVGDTLTAKVTVTDVFYVESIYGNSLCVKMADKNNNRVVAYTASKYFKGYWDDKTDKPVEGVQEGDKIIVSGKVKKHYTYDERFGYKNGDPDVVIQAVKQTQITRIKQEVK